MLSLALLIQPTFIASKSCSRHHSRQHKNIGNKMAGTFILVQETKPRCKNVLECIAQPLVHIIIQLYTDFMSYK